MLYPEDFIEKQFLFVVSSEGEKISFKNDNVIITDKDGKLKHQSTCYRLLAIFIIGHVTITTGIIERSRKFGFAIVLMTVNFRPYQVVSSTAEANVQLRKNQYEYQGLGCAKRIVLNKLKNQRALLMAVRKKTEEQKQSIESIEEYSAGIKEAINIRQIMGIEGNSARVFFKSFFDNVEWIGRCPRIKADMINAILDIGYTILFNFVDVLLAIFGFDRYYGVCHTQFYMRKSLTCDIVEPFRCIIEHQIKKSINLGQFKKCDFNLQNGKWILKIEKNKDYAKIFATAILKNKKEIYIYIRDVYRAFMRGEYENKFPNWEYNGG